MIAVLVLLLAATTVELVDDTFAIPPAEWRYVELALRQQPVTVRCAFETSQSHDVRVALLRREDLDRLKGERPHGLLAATGPAARGTLQHTVRAAGNYAVLVDNRTEAGGPAQVRLRVSLDFSSPAEPLVRYLSPRRRFTVVALSFAAFFGIVFYSARRLLRSVRR